MGIAPYTADPDNKERNFLWQLKDAGLIDHMVISFFVHLTDSYKKMPSTIKFGSYDTSNIPVGEKITMIETMDKTTWDLQATKYTLSQADGIHGKTRLRLHPGVPYLYVTERIWGEFSQTINEKFAQALCQPGTNLCKFDVRCSDVAASLQ